MAVTILAASVAAFLLAWGLSRLVIAAGVLDAPNAIRKVHTTPTPTAGGVGIAVAFAAAMALALSPDFGSWIAAVEPRSLTALAGCVIAAVLLLVIGVIDDLRPLAARPKFVMLAVLSCLYAVLVARADGVTIAANVSLTFPPAFAMAGSALFFFTLVNAVNFMDGANGLAIGSTAIGVAGLAAISLAHGAPHVGIACAIAAAAMAGFLMWNFPNGRLFAGDAGALFCGGLAAGLSLIAVRDAGVSIFIPPILFFPMLADVLLTLAWRVSQRRPTLKSHRDHLFQIGLRHGLSHRRVTMIYWIAALHCALVAFLASFGARVSLGADELRDAPTFFHAAAAAAALAPIAAWATLAIVAMKIAAKVREFAATHALDSE
ncbi:MAG: hypothetical protein KJS97_05930 [Alphaproteobacteria bacterium]|nr:hypothetical protein [Alphaproteobacteria bacterium]